GIGEAVVEPIFVICKPGNFPMHRFNRVHDIGPESLRENLMAQTDTEDWVTTLDSRLFLHKCDQLGIITRMPGPWGKNHAGNIRTTEHTWTELCDLANVDIFT